MENRSKFFDLNLLKFQEKFEDDCLHVSFFIYINDLQHTNND